MKGPVFPWERSKSWGVLGEVEGMKKWDRSLIIEWMELSKHAAVVMRAGNGERKKRLVQSIIDKRNSIIQRAQHGNTSKESGE